MTEKTPNQHDVQHSGKGRPTPKRRESEAGNRRPLVAGDRKAARVQEREARERARAGMLAGDPRYLTARDRGPQKKFARDVVDGRFTLGEITVPFLILFILMAMVRSEAVQGTVTIILYLFVLALVIDCTIMAFQVRRRAARRFGKDKVEKRLGWYAAMRAMQMRLMRVPRPASKRPFSLIGLFTRRRKDGPENAEDADGKPDRSR